MFNIIKSYKYLLATSFILSASLVFSNDGYARSCSDLMYQSGGSYGSSKKAAKRYRLCKENKERYRKSKRTQKDRDRYQRDRKKYYPY